MADSNITEVNCDEILSVEYNAVLAGLCAVLCMFGLVYVFFGYRCFTAVMFLSGLIFGGTTVFLICREERIFQQQFSVEIAAGIAAGIGILCGFITMLVRYVGLFLQGFFLGLLVAVAGILVMQVFYRPTTAWIPGGILFGTGILFSLLTLKFQRAFVIIGTAVLGAGLITTCIDYFLEHFLLLRRYIWEALMSSPSVQLCWYSWVILGVWPLLSFAGTLLQWKVTSKGFDHTDVIIARGRRKQVRTHLVRERHRHGPRSTDGGTGGRRPDGARANDRRRSREPSGGRGGRASRDRANERRRHDDANPTAVAENRAQENVPTQEEEMRGVDEPPSYFECVELGVGEPVTEHHNVVRTESGSYVAPRDRSVPGSVQGDLLQGMASGAGYAVSEEREEANAAPPPQSRGADGGGYVENARLRESQRQNASRPRDPEPIHQDPEQIGVRQEQRDNRHGNRSRDGSHGNHDSSQSANVESSGPSRSTGNQSSKRFRKQGSGRARRSGQESDTQLLLKDPAKAKAQTRGDAVAAHGRRIMAAQNRRINAAASGARDSAGGQAPSSTPASGDNAV